MRIYYDALSFSVRLKLKNGTGFHVASHEIEMLGHFIEECSKSAVKALISIVFDGVV